MKKFTSLFLALAIFVSSNFIAPKSHAVVGLIVKSRVTTVIGGISAGTGVAVAGTTFVVGVANGTLAGAVLAILGLYVGAITAGVGLIVLDDKSIADAEFTAVNKDLAPEFSTRAIAVYNSELEELNAIRKTIQVEVEDTSNVEEANALWNAYNSALSEETVAIAEAQARKFMGNLEAK